MTSKPTLFIVYNASGSLLGHATYAYHHLRQSPGKDCSACALTHGPSLSLSESTGWTALKARLETGGVEGMQGRGVIVKQLHTEDLTESSGLYCPLDSIEVGIKLNYVLALDQRSYEG